MANKVPEIDLEKDSSEVILNRLKSAIRVDGDFPAQTKTVIKIKGLAASPQASSNAVAKLIVGELSLGSRVLSVSNSAFYSRGRAAATVTEALVRLGMRTLTDLCASLVLMDRFATGAKRGGIFAEYVKRAILTSLLSSAIAEEIDQAEATEKAYLAGTFYTLGPLLLAYYFPQVYDAAEERAKAHGHKTSQSISEIIGVPQLELSIAILEAMEIPNMYEILLTEASRSAHMKRPARGSTKLGRALATAVCIAEAMLEADSREQFELIINELLELAPCHKERLYEHIDALPEKFENHCRSVEMDYLTLSEFLREDFDRSEQTSSETKRSESTQQTSNAPSSSAQSSEHYIQELRIAIENGEASSAIMTAAMEALTFGLSFDRAVLLLCNEQRSLLQGQMLIGEDASLDPKSIRRKVKTFPITAEVIAFRSGELQVAGPPMFEQRSTFAAIPIGTGTSTKGVIYADMGAEEELSRETKRQLRTLVDLLGQA